jgi:hypothetical protein
VRSSVNETYPSSGSPIPRSQRPKASSWSGSSSVKSQVHWASGVKSLTTGLKSIALIVVDGGALSAAVGEELGELGLSDESHCDT